MRGNSSSIPDGIRAQLLALGIPAKQHTPDALTTFFPREFNITAANLEVDDLAKVLVYLAGHGIIAPTGPQAAIKPVQPGWHFCQFYRDVDQLLHMIAPYIVEGLQNGEGCLWVLPESVPIEATREALAQSLEDVDRYLDAGQLELLSHPDWYLGPSGRLKSFEEVSGALLCKQDQALTRGFKFLRAAGDAGWVSGTEQSKDFIDYELKVNEAIGATKIAAVCTYRADVTADELVDIICAHQDALSQPQAC